MVGLQKSDKTATKIDEDEMKAARALGGRAFVEGVVSDEITNIVSESAKAAAVETSQGILRAADEARDISHELATSVAASATETALEQFKDALQSEMRRGIRENLAVQSRELEETARACISNSMHSALEQLLEDSKTRVTNAVEELKLYSETRLGEQAIDAVIADRAARRQREEERAKKEEVVVLPQIGSIADGLGRRGEILQKPIDAPPPKDTADDYDSTLITPFKSIIEEIEEEQARYKLRGY